MSADERQWKQPLDLPALGELTALWLEGKGWAPWQTGSPPDEETSALVSSLAAMNRHGYLTEFSQPGVSGDGRQRATVSGFCERDCADRLASLSLASELIVITHYPGGDSTYEIPITDCDGRTFTVAAGQPKGTDLWDEIHPHTAMLIDAAYYVTVLDPQWGQNGLLWPSVTGVLEHGLQGAAGGLIDPTVWE